jgi:carbon-monoxide dehydrogenase iron sulfur subunit
MKVLRVRAERCTDCHLCEEACSETWFKVKDRAKSAIHIGERPKADAPYTVIVCTQCGECIDVCPTKAIRRAANGVVRIDKAECVGCMACVGFCTIWAMGMHADEQAPFKCVASGKCVTVCPENALSIEEEIDPKSSETEKWAERVAA